MEIDYSLLASGIKNEISISNTYTIPKEYFESTDVLALNDITVDGRIYMGPSEDDIDELVEYIKCKISGEMTIADYFRAMQRKQRLTKSAENDIII